MYAKYGCIQVTSTIMTSSGYVVLFAPVLLAPEPAVVCWPGFPKLKFLLSFIDLSMISSQKLLVVRVDIADMRSCCH
jgi:hypothetical protein